MKKAIILVLIFVLLFGLCMPAFSLTLTDYEPYTKDEFPKWSLNLRRAETLFFGGIPIAYPLASLAFSLAGKDAEFLPTLGIACAVSAVISLVDYIIGVASEN
jgi:hypothetical protein